jgi:hypothetical protein
MPLTESKKTINGKTYAYRKQPLTPATELMGVVAQIMGAPLAALASAVGGKVESIGDIELGGGVAQRIATAVMSQLGKSELVLDLIKRLNAGGTVTVRKVGEKGETVVLLANDDVAELWFQEHLADLPAWIAFALEAQLGPFFGGIATAFGLDAGKWETIKTLATTAFGSRTSSGTTGTSSGSSPSA